MNSTAIFVQSSKSVSKKQKVIFYVPTLEGGGAEKVFVNLANYFVNNDYQVICVCAYGNSYSGIIDSMVDIKKPFEKPLFASKMLNTLTRIMFMPLYLFWLLGKNRDAHFFTSVLEADMLGNIVHFLTLSKGKFIIAQAGLIDDVTHPGLLSPFLKWAFKRAETIVANSPETRKSVLTFYPNIENKISLIGNPVYEYKTSQENPFQSPYILNVGRLESQKDHVTLLKAFKIVLTIIDIRLKLVGSGTLQNNLKLLAHDLKISHQIDFEGFKENPEIYYAHAAVFVLSSTHETFANVLVEAMAYGTPVVSTICGGPSYIINDNALGELVPVQEEVILAKAIIKVLQYPKNYDKKAIIARAKDFSIDSIGNQYLRLLNGLNKHRT
jgi:glycosyltransferase involved in cell wall biosynthesis